MIEASGALGLGAVAAAVVAGWNTVKTYLGHLSRMFFESYTLASQTAETIAANLINNGFKPLPTSRKHIFSTLRFLKGSSEGVIVSFKSKLSKYATIYYKGLKFVSFNLGDGTISAPRYVNLGPLLVIKNPIINSDEENRFYVSRKSGSRFLEKSYSKQTGESPLAQSNGNEILSNSQYADAIGISKEELMLKPADVKMIDSLYLTENMKDLLDEAIMWKKSRKWFKERNVPWRRGWCIYGKPGCGKTRFITSIAEKINMPLFTYDLASMTNDDFYNHFTFQHNSDGCIVLIEDIDNVFEGRNNKTNTQTSIGLTFDSLLNTIDGAASVSGVLLAITTNSRSSLDEALVRPGRVDRVVEFNGIDRVGREWIANKIFKGIPSEKWLHMIDKYDDHISGAVYQNDCYKLAMELFWQGKDSQ